MTHWSLGGYVLNFRTNLVSSLHCTYEQLQQLDSEIYRSYDASEEHASNVAGEDNDMGWSTANAVNSGLICF